MLAFAKGKISREARRGICWKATSLEWDEKAPMFELLVDFPRFLLLGLLTGFGSTASASFRPPVATKSDASICSSSHEESLSSWDQMDQLQRKTFWGLQCCDWWLHQIVTSLVCLLFDFMSNRVLITIYFSKNMNIKVTVKCLCPLNMKGCLFLNTNYTLDTTTSHATLVTVTLPLVFKLWAAQYFKDLYSATSKER